MRRWVAAVMIAGLGVAAVAAGAYATAGRGGGASTASERPEVTPAIAVPPGAIVCAEGASECDNRIANPGSELTCEEAQACTKPDPGAWCALGATCVEPAPATAVPCLEGRPIEECYPRARPAGPYLCERDPAGGVRCRPPYCIEPPPPEVPTPVPPSTPRPAMRVLCAPPAPPCGPLPMQPAPGEIERACPLPCLAPLLEAGDPSAPRSALGAATPAPCSPCRAVLPAPAPGEEHAPPFCPPSCSAIEPPAESGGMEPMYRLPCLPSCKGAVPPGAPEATVVPCPAAPMPGAVPGKPPGVAGAAAAGTAVAASATVVLGP